LDHVVHINNGSWETEPIFLHLAPGEETSFHLKVVNHGEPTNITLKPSEPMIRALRLKRLDRYLVLEENIPIQVVMPEGQGKIEGEILLTSNGEDFRVPISLTSDSMEDEEPFEVREGFEDPDDGEIEDQIDDQEDYFEEAEDRDDEPETGNAGSRRIRFSKERDVQSYRASMSRQGEADLRYEERQPSSYQEEWKAEPVREPEPQSYRDYDSYESASSAPESTPAEEEYEPTEHGKGIFSIGDRETMQIIPGLMLIAISALLVLTFYAEKIPEFPGALASSILIVTLIIYGAATLLKA
jgi:hypothetical protein